MTKTEDQKTALDPSEVISTLRDYLNEKGLEIIDEMSRKTQIPASRILDIYNLANASQDEIEGLFPYLQKELRVSEKEVARELKRLEQTIQIEDATAAKPKEIVGHKLNLPTRAGLRRLFLSNRFRRMKSQQVAYVYSNPDVELRLVCETGLYPPGKNEKPVEGSQFAIKGDLKFYILDTRTNRRISKLVRSFVWHSVEGSPNSFLTEKIADFLVEANYRPFCPIHSKYYDLTVPSGDDSRQFWSCHECYNDDKKRRSTENIKVNLTSERFVQTVGILQAQINNLRRKSLKKTGTASPTN